ncbi:MAG: hypothetical protein M1825_003931 [Sarcosagium campestre]|nr:MAG: hypothetical protein M1825_003931 [Sarcosagium campestre]
MGRRHHLTGKVRAEAAGERRPGGTGTVEDDFPRRAPISLGDFTVSASCVNRNKGSKAYRPLRLSDLPPEVPESNVGPEADQVENRTEKSPTASTSSNMGEVDQMLLEDNRELAQSQNAQGGLQNIIEPTVSPFPSCALSQSDLEVFPAFELGPPDDPTVSEILSQSPDPTRSKPLSEPGPSTVHHTQEELFARLGIQARSQPNLQAEAPIEKSNGAIGMDPLGKKGSVKFVIRQRREAPQTKSLIAGTPTSIQFQGRQTFEANSQEGNVDPRKKPIPENNGGNHVPQRRILLSQLNDIAGSGATRALKAEQTSLDVTRAAREPSKAESLSHRRSILPSAADLHRLQPASIPSQRDPSYAGTTDNTKALATSEQQPPADAAPMVSTLTTEELRASSRDLIALTALSERRANPLYRQVHQDQVLRSAETWWGQDARRQTELRAYLDQVTVRELDPTLREQHETEPEDTGPPRPEAEISNRLLSHALCNLHAYLTTPPQQQRDCFGSFASVPDWCRDTSNEGIFSFFGEDWGAPPARVGRDPRYRPVAPDPHFPTFDGAAVGEEWSHGNGGNGSGSGSGSVTPFSRRYRQL